MGRWMLMCSFSLSASRVVMAAAACSALFVIALPSATAAPAADDQGYVDLHGAVRSAERGRGVRQH